MSNDRIRRMAKHLLVMNYTEKGHFFDGHLYKCNICGMELDSNQILYHFKKEHFSIYKKMYNYALEYFEEKK